MVKPKFLRATVTLDLLVPADWAGGNPSRQSSLVAALENLFLADSEGEHEGPGGAYLLELFIRSYKPDEPAATAYVSKFSRPYTLPALLDPAPRSSEPATFNLGPLPEPEGGWESHDAREAAAIRDPHEPPPYPSESLEWETEVAPLPRPERLFETKSPEAFRQEMRFSADGQSVSLVAEADGLPGCPKEHPSNRDNSLMVRCGYAASPCVWKQHGRWACRLRVED